MFTDENFQEFFGKKVYKDTKTNSLTGFVNTVKKILSNLFKDNKVEEDSITERTIYEAISLTTKREKQLINRDEATALYKKGGTLYQLSIELENYKSVDEAARKF